MKIKDFIALCKDDYCLIDIYDKRHYTTEHYKRTSEVINQYGYFPLLEWEINNNILKITTQTEF